ncbi:RNA-directed DNA polymerase, eukaryota [Tanacetum coccineum]
MNSDNDMSDLYNYYSQGDIERYARYFKYFEPCETLDNEGESLVRNSEKHTMIYISREREVAEEKLRRDYFGDENNPPISRKNIFGEGESLRRPVRGGAEEQQFAELALVMDSVVCSSLHDRWVCTMSSDVRRDCLPTRVNLINRGVTLESSSCPMCCSSVEDVHHVLLRCSLAQAVLRRVCRWWDLDWQPWLSFSDWSSWFESIRLPAGLNCVLEGVFFVSWWSIWGLRNRIIFSSSSSNRSVIFDDIVSFSMV